jgi:hypothetical protein
MLSSLLPPVDPSSLADFTGKSKYNALSLAFEMLLKKYGTRDEGFHQQVIGKWDNDLR